MNFDRMQSTLRTAGLSLVMAAVFATGCKQAAPAVDDNTLASSIQSKIGSDAALSGEGIQVGVSGGVATLNGNVSSNAAKTLASNDAASVNGVKTVVNNLNVQAPPPAQAATVAPEPAPVAPVKEHSAKTKTVVVERKPAPEPPPVVRQTPAPAPAPVPVVAQAPPPPPAPVTKTVTVAAGTYLPVRITQGLDSATTQTGDAFTGVISNDIVVDGWVALRQGTPVSGRVVEAKDAAHFKGSSLLSIELTSISRRGERIAVSTEAFSKEGAGRGKNTATKAGVGAAAGAILGGIFGGGKGAAIGAAAGGAGGAGINAITRGEQVQIPTESLIRFRLTNAFSVVASPVGSSSNDAPSSRRPM